MCKAFLNSKEVAEAIGCRDRTARNVIAKLNKEQATHGVKIMPGKVSKAYFEKAYGIKVEI